MQVNHYLFCKVSKNYHCEASKNYLLQKTKKKEEEREKVQVKYFISGGSRKFSLITGPTFLPVGLCIQWMFFLEVHAFGRSFFFFFCDSDDLFCVCDLSYLIYT